MVKKESRGVTSGVGPPSKMEGRNGDLTVRRTKEGQILYVKNNNIWHPLNTGIDIVALKKDVERIKRTTSLFGI